MKKIYTRSVYARTQDENPDRFLMEASNRERNNFRPMKKHGCQTVKCKEAVFRTAHNRMRWHGEEVCRGQMYGIFQGVPRIVSGEMLEHQGRTYYKVRSYTESIELAQFREEWIPFDSDFGSAITVSMTFNKYGREMPKESTDTTGSKPVFVGFTDKRPNAARLPKPQTRKNYLDEMLTAERNNQGATWAAAVTWKEN